MIRLPAADRGHDLQWLVDTGGDLDADVVAMAVGRHINGMVSGAPVLALHPDTEAYCDMVAVRISPDRSTSMRALVAMGGCLHIQGRDCRLLPFTITRSGLARNPPRERQTDRVAAATMDVRAGGWGGIARHGPVVIRTPTNDVSHQVPEGRTTEAMRRDTRAGLLGFPVDGPYCSRHSVLGATSMVWLHGDDAGNLELSDLVLEAGESVVRFFCGQVGMASAHLEQESIGTGVVNWRGEIRPGEALFCAMVAGGRATIDGVAEICEIPMTSKAWVAIHLPHRGLTRAAASGLDLTCRVSLLGVRRGVWRASIAAAPAREPTPPIQPTERSPDPVARNAENMRGGLGGVREWLCNRLRNLECEWGNGRTDTVDGGVELAGMRMVGIDDFPRVAASLRDWQGVHARRVLDRGRPARWRWDWALWGWMLEAAGIHELARADPALFHQFLAELRVPARERRQAPVANWQAGRTAMAPGVPLPGMRAAGAVHGTLYMGCPPCLAEAWTRGADMAMQSAAMGTAAMDVERAGAGTCGEAGTVEEMAPPRDATMEAVPVEVVQTAGLAPPCPCNSGGREPGPLRRCNISADGGKSQTLRHGDGCWAQ